MVRGAPRNAANSESDSTRYLPAFTEEIAYMTTKNASSKRYEVAIGNGPRLVVGVLIVAPDAPCHDGLFATHDRRG